MTTQQELDALALEAMRQDNIRKRVQAQLIAIAQCRQNIIARRAVLAAEMTRLDNRLNALRTHEISLQTDNTKGLVQ